MRNINFYPGIYKALAIAVCLMLFFTINKSKAAGMETAKHTTSLKNNLLPNKQ